MLPASIHKRPYHIISKELIASGIFELRLKPDDIDNEIPMPEAGQWVYLELSNEEKEASGLRRAYSIASAPYEIKKSNGELKFAIKIAGEVSKKIDASNEGDRLWLQGPFGRFVLSHESHPVLFIAGGIGLTPLRSMLLESLRLTPTREITLLLSCRIQDEIPYHDDWITLAAENPSFRYLPTCTRESSESWKGNHGRISEDIIREQLSHIPDADVFLCGPTALMDSTAAILKGVGVEATRIHTEKFG